MTTPADGRQVAAPVQVYRRELPGGGYAAVEIVTARRLWNREYRGRVIVERRAVESRRAGHLPPVVLEARARSSDELLTELIPVVLSNTALATGCLLRGGCRPSRPPG